MTQDNKQNKWLEILDFQPKHLGRTPTKIHRERRRQRQQEAACKAQTTSLSPAKATSSTQWRKILQLRDKWSRRRERTPTADASKSDGDPVDPRPPCPESLYSISLYFLEWGISSEHFKWPSISQVLCYSTPLQRFCWPESNRFLS